MTACAGRLQPHSTTYKYLDSHDEDGDHMRPLLFHLVAGLFNYGVGRRKEDDLALRKRLIGEITKSKEHLNNILEETYQRNDKKGAEAVKRAIDEVDAFKTEVNLSVTGHTYPFFSDQRSVGREDLDKLMKFDQEMIEKMENVTMASQKIESIMIDEEGLELVAEAKKMRLYITTARNAYKDRTEFIRGLK